MTTPSPKTGKEEKHILDNCGFHPFDLERGEAHSACAARVKQMGGKVKCCYCNPHENCKFTSVQPEAKTSDEVVEEAVEDIIGDSDKLVRSTLIVLAARVREEARRQGQIDNAISLDAAMIHDLKNAKVGDKAHALLQSVRKEGALAVLADLEGKLPSGSFEGDYNDGFQDMRGQARDLIASLRASLGEK